MAGVLATTFDSDVVERHTLRWNEDLTAKERAVVASALETKRNIPEFKWVPVGDLYVDDTYQRELSNDRVWDIVTQFSWQLFQSLWIADRGGKGKLFIVDGRHRYAAALTLGKGDMPKVPCEVRKTVSVEEEANIFINLQEKRRSLSSLAKFRARLVMHDPGALAIESALKRYDLTTAETDVGSANSYSLASGTITAFGSLFKAYDAGGKNRIDDVLFMVRNAWDAVVPTQSAPMMSAFNRVFEMVENAHGVRQTWAKRLSQKDPWGLLERGQRHGHSNGISATQAIADVLATFLP